MDYDFNKDQILNNDLPNKIDKVTQEASKTVEQKIEEATKAIKTLAPNFTGKNTSELNSGDRVQNIINQFDKKSLNSMRGYELDDRYRNRANKNVSNIVGKGLDTVGTTEGAMRELVKEANAKGYLVIFTKKNDSTIDVNLVPMEKYTNDTADYGNDKINFNIRVGSQGRIADGKINAVSLHTEFYDSDELDDQGKSIRKAALRLETAETRQLKNIINRLPTYKDSKDKRSNKKIGQYLLSKAAEAIHRSPQPGSLGYNKAEYEDEEIDDLREFAGKLSEIEAMRSTNYTIDEYLTSVMTSNTGVKKFFEDYINRNNKSKTRKKFNPHKPGSQISNALIEAYHIAMNGIDSKKMEAMPEDSLVKMILKGGGEGNPFGYMLRDAETMGRILGVDYTGLSEGKYGRGIVLTTSSRNFTPTGEMYDYTQRSLSLRYGNMSLTDKAKELRNRADSVSGKNTMVTQRGQWANINYDSEEHNTYGVKFVSLEEYNLAQRQYFKEKGYSDELIETSLKDLTDSIVIAKNVVDEMEGWQLNSSEALLSEDLNWKLLSTLGITSNQMEKTDSILIEGGYTADGSEYWSKDFRLNAGDKIVGLKKTVDDGWKLIVERLRVLKDGSKMVTNWGNRVTKQGNDDYSEWMINHFGGKGGQNFQAIMLENNDLKERNYANYFGGMLFLIQELSRQMDIPLEELFKSLTEMFPMLDKMFEISKDGTKLVDLMRLDEKNGYITSDRANGENIFGNPEDTASMLKGLDSFGLLFFGKDKWDSSIRRMEVLLHDVYPYEDPSGYGSATTLERYGRVNDDYKVRDARMRNMNFVGFEAVKNASEESKGDIQRGLDILKEQQQKRDLTFGKKGKTAQLSRQQLQAAVKSIDSSSGYIAEQGVKDVEFVSKASLNGQEALLNQLVIEDLMTDFSELVENGMLSPDDYSKFAMEIARQTLITLSENDAAYKNGHIIFDGSAMLPGGKKIIMGDIAGSMSPGGKYFPSETDTYNSKILEAAKNGDKTELRAAILSARDKYSYIADNKDSQVYRDATHNYVPYSSFMIADSGALGIDLNKVTDADLNTAWMSKERYTSQIRTAQNGTTKDRIQNIKNLFLNYKLRSSEDYKKQSREDKDLFYEDLYKKTDEELIALEEKIIKWITDSIEGGNRNYTTEMGRYPYTQGMEGNKMRVGFDNTLGNDKVKLSAGMLASLRGDTDGDKLRMALGFGDYSGYSKADKEKGFAAEQEMLKYYDRYARVMEEMVKSDYEKNPDLAQREKSLDKIAADLESRITNLEASREAKGSFTLIGMFSNAATNMRRSLDTTGFATEDLREQKGKVHAFLSGVIRALLETFEQEAISSKKIYARIKGANTNMSDEQAYDEVQSLAALLLVGDFQGFMGSADKLGILGDLLNGKQFRSLRGQWAATQDTDFLKSIESLYGINGFFGSDSLDMGTNKANLMNMISGSFRSFEEYLGDGRNLKDAFEYNEKIDSEERTDHTSRKDFTYEKGSSGSPGGNGPGGNGPGGNGPGGNGPGGNGPGGPTNPGGSSGPTGSNGPFIINTTNTVEVNGAEVNIEGANINGNVGGTTNAHKAGLTAAPNQVNLKNESGDYVFKTNNNAKEYKHVTEILQPYHEPVSPYDTKGLKAAALGTYAHSMVEELVKTGNDYVEELTDGVKEAEEQLTRPYEQGGAGMDVNEHDIALRRRLAEISAKLAREKGLVNSTSLTERNVKASLGSENISGTSDLLTFNKDENGNYTGVTLSDWKFSSKGGEDDPGQRALRVVLASTYVRMQEAKYAEALKRVQEGQKLEQSEIADLGLEGENTEEQNKDLEAKLKAFSNAKIAIIRSFIKGEDIYNDIAEGTALSENEVGEATEAMINHKGIRTSDYLKSAGLVTSYAKNGNLINRPDFVKMPGLLSGSSLNAIINQYVANQKAQYRMEEDIARAEARGKNYTGELAANNDLYIAALKSRLTLLKLQLSLIDINSLSEEDQLKLLAKLNNATSEHSVKLAQVNVNLKELKSLLEKFAGTIGLRIHSFFDFSLAYMAINKLRQGLQTLINTTTELDSKLVNLQIAIGGTREETHDLLQSYVSLAKELGRTVSEVADAANSWYRSGYRGAEAMELTKASMQLSTLGMIDSANATSYLVSALKGWKLEASEVSEVVDKLVTLDMNAAVSAGELAEAMSRANNSARLAGVSMNTYMGYLTTVIDTTQKSAESVGQSFQTIFSRFQNIKAGKFAASYEDTLAEGYSEDNFEALNDVETVLNRVGVKVRDNASEWRNIEDVIDEIAGKWSSWDKTTQNAVASAVAGTRQRENVVTLFTNYDEVAKYAEIATDSYGNAKEKMEAYTDSVEAAKKRITTATEEWALKLNLADSIKKFYKIIASLVENLDKVLIGGGLIAILTNLGGAANLVATGLSKIGNSLFSLGTAKSFGLDLYKGGFAGLANLFNAPYNAALIELYNANLAQYTATLGSANVATAQSMQTTLLGMKEETAGTIIKAAKRSVDEKGIAVGLESLTADEMDTLTTMLLTTTEGQRAQLEYNNILTSQNLDDQELRLIVALEVLQKVWERLALSGGNLTNEIDKNTATFAQNKNKGMSTTLAGVASIGGMALGSYGGEKALETIGIKNSGMIGTMLGGMAGSAALKTLSTAASALPGIISGTTTAAAAGLSAGPIVAAVAAVGALVVGAIKAKKEKDEAKKLEEALTKFKEAEEALTSAKSAISTAKKVEELSKGVDALGRNVSLSEDDYASFLENSNKLAEVFPEMVQRVDESGNKIVELGNVSEQTALKINSLLIASDNALLQENVFNDAIKKADTDYLEYLNLITEIENKKQYYHTPGNYQFLNLEVQSAYENMISGDNGYYDLSQKGYDLFLDWDLSKDKIDQADAAILSIYNKYGVDPSNPKMGWYMDISDEDRKIWENAANVKSNYEGYDLALALDFYNFDESSKGEGRLAWIENEIRQSGETKDLFISKYNTYTLDEANKNESTFDTELQKENAIKSADASIAQLKQLQDNINALMNDYMMAILRQYGNFNDLDNGVLQVIEQALNGSISIYGDNEEVLSYQEYRTNVLSAYEELSNLFSSDPILVDLALKANTAETAGEAQIAREELKNALIESMGGLEDLDDNEKAILLKFGFEYDPKANKVNDTQDVLSLFEQTDSGKDFVNKFGLGNYSTEKVQKAYELYNSGIVDSSFSRELLDNLIRSDLSGGNTVLEAIGYQAQLLAAAPSLDQRLESFYNSNKNSRREVTSSMVAKEFSDLPENLRNSILEGANEIREGTKEMGTVISENFDEYSTSLLNSKMNVAKTLAAKTFSGMDAGQDGIIGEWSELADMLDLIAASYEKLKSAQQEQNAAGKLSWQTTLGLLNTNVEYINALEVTEKGIRLKKDAEEQMAKVQVATARANIQAKISELEAENADIDAKLQNYKTTGVLVESSNALIDANAALVESLNTLADAYANTAAYARDLTAAEHGSEETTVTGKVSANHVETYKQYVKYSGDAAKQKADALKVQKDENAKTIKLLKLFDTDMSKLENSGYSYDTFNKTFNTPDLSGGDTAEDALNKIKAMVESIDKEYQQMIAYGKEGIRGIDETAQHMQKNYYDLKEKYLKMEAEELMNLYSQNTGVDEEKALGYLKDYYEVQKQIANLDDEQVQDKIDMLESQEVNNRLLLEQYYLLLDTADTEAERLEYQKKINDALKEEYDLRKGLQEYYIELTNTQMKYITVGEHGYRNLVDQQLEYYDNIADYALDEYYRLWEKNYQANLTNGMSSSLAAVAADEADEVQSAMKDYLSAYEQFGDVLYNNINDVLDRIEQSINTLQTAKPNEFGSKTEILAYYGDLYEKNKQILEETEAILSDSYLLSRLTDELITEITNKANEASKSLRDIQSEQLEALINYDNEVYSAINDTVNEYIDNLNLQKKRMEEYYDEEIEKLTEKQTSIERTNRLIELQNDLLNAQQEKERVYVEGVGWTYRQNRTKVKSAEKSLKDFNLSDQISDLEKAKSEEGKVLDQAIENWNEYLKMLEYKYSEYQRINNARLLMELLGVKSEEEIYTTLSTDMTNFMTYTQTLFGIYNSSMEGLYGGFTTSMSDWLDDYTGLMIQKQAIDEQWVKTLNPEDYTQYNNSNDAVEKAEEAKDSSNLKAESYWSSSDYEKADTKDESDEGSAGSGGAASTPNGAEYLKKNTKQPVSFVGYTGDDRTITHGALVGNDFGSSTIRTITHGALEGNEVDNTTTSKTYGIGDDVLLSSKTSSKKPQSLIEKEEVKNKTYGIGDDTSLKVKTSEAESKITLSTPSETGVEYNTTYQPGIFREAISNFIELVKNGGATTTYAAETTSDTTTRKIDESIADFVNANQDVAAKYVKSTEASIAANKSRVEEERAMQKANQEETARKVVDLTNSASAQMAVNTQNTTALTESNIARVNEERAIQLANKEANEASAGVILNSIIGEGGLTTSNSLLKDSMTGEKGLATYIDKNTGEQVALNTSISGEDGLTKSTKNLKEGMTGEGGLATYIDKNTGQQIALKDSIGNESTGLTKTIKDLDATNAEINKNTGLKGSVDSLKTAVDEAASAVSNSKTSKNSSSSGSINYDNSSSSSFNTGGSPIRNDTTASVANVAVSLAKASAAANAATQAAVAISNGSTQVKNMSSSQKSAYQALQDRRGYAGGIDEGPVTFTGLAMLHGTPSSPEYVLNSDQAYSLLRYMATTKASFESNLQSSDTIYNFQGGITMNGVNDPEAFFSELTRAMSNRFNVTKNR